MQLPNTSQNVKIKYKKLYGVFDGMKQRCKNPNRKDFSRYGGRGIVFDKKWQTFSGFFKDMGSSYKEGLTLDRIDNNGNYCKENCRWVTPKEQANNRKSNVSISYKGVTLNSSQWAKKIGINKTTFQYRKSMGWNLERLMTSGLRPNN